MSIEEESGTKWLLDQREIIAVAINYTWALDEGRYRDLRDVFTPDATAELGTSTLLEGLDDIDRARGHYERGIEIAAKKGDLSTAQKMQDRLNALTE